MTFPTTQYTREEELSQESGDLTQVCADLFSELSWLYGFIINTRMIPRAPGTPCVLGSCVTILFPLDPGILAPGLVLPLISVP